MGCCRPWGVVGHGMLLMVLVPRSMVARSRRVGVGEPGAGKRKSRVVVARVDRSGMGIRPREGAVG